MSPALVLAFVLLAAAPARAQSSAEREIRRAEEQMHDAYVHHKTALFDSLYADDATFTYNTGKRVTKAERVDGFEKAPPFVGEQDVVQKIRVYGDVAIVNCLTTYPNRDKTQMTALEIWASPGLTDTGFMLPSCAAAPRTRRG